MTWHEVEEYRDVEWYETAISNGAVEFIINNRKNSTLDVLNYLSALEACAATLEKVLVTYDIWHNDQDKMDEVTEEADKALSYLDRLRGDK